MFFFLNALVNIYLSNKSNSYLYVTIRNSANIRSVLWWRQRGMKIIVQMILFSAPGIWYMFDANEKKLYFHWIYHTLLVYKCMCKDMDISIFHKLLFLISFKYWTKSIGFCPKHQLNILKFFFVDLILIKKNLWPKHN